MKIKLYNCLGDNEQISSQYALGLGYLKTNCTGADIEIVTDRAELINCDMIGLSAVAGGVKEAVDIVQTSKIPVVIGGQATLWEGLKQYPFRHIVKGEGELAFQAIINDVHGLTRVMNGINIAELDTLNYPDRGKCDKVIPILTSRGCPWNCYFCSSQNYWGKPRYHSPEYFIGETKNILGTYRQAKLLYVLDDLFIADKNRFEKIFDLWMSNALDDYLMLNGFVRSNLMTEDIARKLKLMGFVSVRFGAESGSDKVLKTLNKTSTVEDHQRCIDICNSVELPVCYSVISHTPGETDEDRKLTMDFIERNRDKAQVAGNYVFRPFPGTKYYNGESLVEGNWNTR
jgi:radical SAM superfamily enzyme YgiQ (UPF0313 family)